MTDDADEVLALLHKIAPCVEPASVERARPLVDQLDVDSMDYQNLLAAISTRYAIPIPETDMRGLRSIHDLVLYVHVHSQAR